MWWIIGILALAAVAWVCVGNKDGGNSPADWARDITRETRDDIHDRYWGEGEQ